MFHDKYPEHKVVKEYSANEPTYKIQLLIEGNYLAESAFSMDMYSNVSETFKMEIENKSKDCYPIDHDLAQSVILE